jgi:RimJ/RimL family protein N-acetyltransferase
MMLKAPRLRLHMWHERHRAPFAAMSADVDVMRDLGGPMSRAESDAKFDRYAKAWEDDAIGRWAVEDTNGNFLGYAGIVYRREHPIGPHHDLGWRFMRDAWGKGYATEAAKAALYDAFTRTNISEALAYTAPDNLRSQAVMARLGLKRDPSRDFSADFGNGDWRGLMWVAQQA